ncbi:rubrivinodin family lasso peptide [Pelomonas aquatica]
MNEAPQLEIVELGDAKEETKGLTEGIRGEVNEAAPYVKP